MVVRRSSIPLSKRVGWEGGGPALYVPPVYLFHCVRPQLTTTYVFAQEGHGNEGSTKWQLFFCSMLTFLAQIQAFVEEEEIF